MSGTLEHHGCKDMLEALAATSSADRVYVKRRAAGHEAPTEWKDRLAQMATSSASARCARRRAAGLLTSSSLKA
jgi:hypothetical protein